MITCTSTSPLSGADQAVTDGVHDLRFCSCTTRNGAEERGLSAHVVASSFLLRVPQQLQPDLNRENEISWRRATAHK